MGNTIQLMGLAALNVFVAIILSVAFLSGGGAGARIQNIDRLTEETVTGFITDLAAITTGKRGDMNAYAVTAFLMDHIDDDGLFKTRIDYGGKGSRQDLEMDKKSYISNVLNELKNSNGRETLVRIENVRINEGGRSAVAVTSNYERGMMPVQDEMGETVMMPVDGASYCEQIITLADKNMLQVSSATCMTNISFSSDL